MIGGHNIVEAKAVKNTFKYNLSNTQIDLFLILIQKVVRGKIRRQKIWIFVSGLRFYYE